MTCLNDSTLPSESPLTFASSLSDALLESVLEQLVAGGFAALPDAIRVLMNAAMRAERQQFLGAAEHERSESRAGYANGYKPKTVRTRVGEVTLSVPQVRDL